MTRSVPGGQQHGQAEPHDTLHATIWGCREGNILAADAGGDYAGASHIVTIAKAQ